MQNQINKLKQEMQFIENLQISSLLDPTVSISDYRILKAKKESLNASVRMLESQLPKVKKSFSVKPLLHAAFPTIYYIIGR